MQSQRNAANGSGSVCKSVVEYRSFDHTSTTSTNNQGLTFAMKTRRRNAVFRSFRAVGYWPRLNSQERENRRQCPLAFEIDQENELVDDSHPRASSDWVAGPVIPASQRAFHRQILELRQTRAEVERLRTGCSSTRRFSSQGGEVGLPAPSAGRLHRARHGNRVLNRQVNSLTAPNSREVQWHL